MPNSHPARTTAEFLSSLGTVFQVFGEQTQDSGHVSYGVQAADGSRFFVKTAGLETPSPAGRSQAERIQLLRKAAAVQLDAPHPAFIPIRRVVNAPDGIAVVYDWFGGELLRSPASRRGQPGEAQTRFQHLPLAEIVRALDRIVDLHAHLAKRGWVAGDFYDGCLMYDFHTQDIRFMDLECYQPGPYPNAVGRLPGSTRFMAPEEFVRGALIDGRTTVFNLGRLLDVFMVNSASLPALRRLIGVATAPDPANRLDSPVTFQEAWREVIGDIAGG